MNKKAKILFKNINYTVSANFLVLAISAILNLIVPKFIGVKEYGFWQLYVFYSSYVGFFHFGWLDGLYLKIGGSEYEDLDKPNLGTQFWYLTFMQVIIAFIFFLFTLFASSTQEKSIIIMVTSLNLIVTNCRLFILYVLQSTNRFKEYAILSRSDRYIYIICVGIYIACHGKNFEVLIILDVVSKFITLFWGISRIRDLLFSRLVTFRKIYLEIINNIVIGSNLLISNIASLLILGINRVMVERQWSIETFGKLSFTLSISNMFMTFINAVGVVMFPFLRRTDGKSLPSLYVNLRMLFVPVTYGILLFFIPTKFILNLWLPEYSQSLNFMGILFPMVIYEGRMALLVNTYLKTIRKEKIILLTNIVTLILSSVLSFISVFIINDIYLSVMAIMFSLAFRCIYAERMLFGALSIIRDSSVIVETFLTLVFILANIFCSEPLSFVLYSISFVTYILINMRKIQNSYKILLNKIKS